MLNRMPLNRWLATQRERAVMAQWRRKGGKVAMGFVGAALGCHAAFIASVRLHRG